MERPMPKRHFTNDKDELKNIHPSPQGKPDTAE